ncbi:MAG: VacB/RNase II family 3'-5' exoribonuclease [Halieaceae bacterium]|jgi:ribonuclease R|nr:VacB/RNase II family 3'-5' exoribonuclease [Halieaceae bacterium]
MLNQDSLAQLKGLKAQMEAEKERAEAVIKGTQARYGFAVLDDGREIFIPPDEMLKAFPDDRVRVCIRPDRGDKPIAEVEKLLECPIGEFNGRCVRKGKALFVEPDLPRLSRWLFIPPHARNGVKEGDFVRAALLRHPIRDGKPQAKVLSIIGNAETIGIENLYTATKYQLSRDWSDEALAELDAGLASAEPLDDQRRRDLTDLEFVSIDSARTQDIDDALYAAPNSNGWCLYVAIADPTPFITPGSTLDQEIAARGTSIYFHGDAIAMLPERLSQENCALAEGEDRPALVCKIEVKDSGEVGEFEFIEAVVRSRAKLSYIAVDRYLAGNYDELMSHATPLEALYQVYRALRGHREEQELVMEERPEYRWMLNDQKKIERIEKCEKLLSQKLVEECMVAANRCCAQFLKERDCAGPFIGHRGFRPDRKDEIKRFMTRFMPDFVEQDLGELAVYRSAIQRMNQSDDLPLRSMANRLLARAELLTKAAPHMGMGLECYSNCTSPLRKYVDFLVHRQIKAVLHGDASSAISNTELSGLAARLATVRQATREAEVWLQCEFLAGNVGEEFDAVVAQISSSGFTARLLDNGIEGQVDLRKDPEKFSFDRWAATLSSPSRTFQLEQPVKVRLERADATRREIQFAPVPDSSPAPDSPDKSSP